MRLPGSTQRPSRPIDIVVYSRADCHLCDVAKIVLRDVAEHDGLAIDLREVDVDSDAELRERYTNDVPVVFIEGRKAFKHRIDPSRLSERFRRILERRDQGGAVSELSEKECVPCRGGVPALKGPDLEDLLSKLGGGWRIVDEHHLEKEWQFPDFRAALEFTNRVGELAEAQGHHPDIHLGWGRARITIWTHKIDGLTESDFVLAAKIDLV